MNEWINDFFVTAIVNSIDQTVAYKRHIPDSKTWLLAVVDLWSYLHRGLRPREVKPCCREDEKHLCEIMNRSVDDFFNL